jgi:hypothetical protein
MMYFRSSPPSLIENTSVRKGCHSAASVGANGIYILHYQKAVKLPAQWHIIDWYMTLLSGIDIEAVLVAGLCCLSSYKFHF